MPVFLIGKRPFWPYREKAVLAAMPKNNEYVSAKKTMEMGNAGKPIYKRNRLEATGTLVPEPNNKQNKNAIMVKCGIHHIGYIFDSDLQKVWGILKNAKIDHIHVSVHGGPYHVISGKGEETKCEMKLRGTVTIGYYK